MTSYNSESLVENGADQTTLTC